MPRANHSSSPCKILGLGQPQGEQKLHLSRSLQRWGGGGKGELSLLAGLGLAATALIVLSGEEPASLQVSAGGFLCPALGWCLAPGGSYLPEGEAGSSLGCLVAWEKRHQGGERGEVSPSVCASIRAVPLPHREGFAQLPSISGGKPCCSRHGCGFPLRSRHLRASCCVIWGRRYRSRWCVRALRATQSVPPSYRAHPDPAL